MYLLKQKRRLFCFKDYYVFPLCVVWQPNLMYYCEPTSELSIHFLCWHWQWQFRKGRNPIKAKSPIYCDEWNNDGSSHVNAAIVMSGVKSCDPDHH